MLSKRINDIDQKIKELDFVSGFKKSIAEFNKINNELEICKNELSKIEEQVNCNSDTDVAFSQRNENNKIDEQINDNNFNDFLLNLRMITEIFPELDIEEQIKLYQDALNKIKLCEKYLETRKIEIIYIDKKS